MNWICAVCLRLCKLKSGLGSGKSTCCNSKGNSEIMNQYPSHANLTSLLEALETLFFTLDGSGAEMAFPPNGGLPLWLSDSPPLAKALEEIERITGLSALHVMVNRLKPGVVVPVHRDFLLPTPLQQRNHPTIERWHLPVVTNNECLWWGEDTGTIHFPKGEWMGFLPYWKKHQVWNAGQTERVHLVVDLDTPVHLGEYE